MKPDDDNDLGEPIPAVVRERRRQEQLKSENRYTYTCADISITNSRRLAILLEKIGCVAQVLNEYEEGRTSTHDADAALWNTLVEVSASSVAWLEHLRKKYNNHPPYTATRL